MNKNVKYANASREQNGEQRRNCERCGRSRPTNTERFTVTASDFSDSTVAYEKTLLCGECWRHVRDEIRRCIA